jgi:hypothetical protein
MKKLISVLVIFVLFFSSTINLFALDKSSKGKEVSIVAENID